MSKRDKLLPSYSYGEPAAKRRREEEDEENNDPTASFVEPAAALQSYNANHRPTGSRPASSDCYVEEFARNNNTHHWYTHNESRKAGPSGSFTSASNQCTVPSGSRSNPLTSTSNSNQMDIEQREQRVLALYDQYLPEAQNKINLNRMNQRPNEVLLDRDSMRMNASEESSSGAQDMDLHETF